MRVLVVVDARRYHRVVQRLKYPPGVEGLSLRNGRKRRVKAEQKTAEPEVRGGTTFERYGRGTHISVAVDTGGNINVDNVHHTSSMNSFHSMENYLWDMNRRIGPLRFGPNTSGAQQYSSLISHKSHCI